MPEFIGKDEALRRFAKLLSVELKPSKRSTKTKKAKRQPHPKGMP